MATSPHIRCVIVFGGTGFLGGQIVERLASEGIPVRVAVRHPDDLRTDDITGDVQPVYADVRDGTSVEIAMQGADAAVNAVGLYIESGAETFEAVHERGAEYIARHAAAKGLERLVHVSGIGADLRSPSDYVRSRAKGEIVVMNAFPKATVLRPGVMFGPDDAFLNALAHIARRTPVLPIFGRGTTRLQPVYVGDVARAVVRALRKEEAPGRTYELGGPHIYAYRRLVQLVLRQAGLRRLLLPVPFPVWDGIAAIASRFPAPPITRAQVTLMKRDNLVASEARTFEHLGIHPTALEEILPKYAF